MMANEITCMKEASFERLQFIRVSSKRLPLEYYEPSMQEEDNDYLFIGETSRARGSSRPE